MKGIFREFRRLISRRMFIALLILGQIALLIALFFRSYHVLWVVRCLNLLSVVTALHLLTRRDKSAFKLSLVFLILLFPLVGGALYWILHFQTASINFRKDLKRIEERSLEWTRKTGASKDLISQAEQETPACAKLIRYLQNIAGFTVHRNTEARYFSHGKEMLDMLLQDLEASKRYIFLEYFIVEDGKMWGSILEILKKKAAEGIDVRIIYDDLGSFLTLPPNYAKQMRACGIKCYPFNQFHPFLTSMQNNRDHRKIAAIDGQIAYTGGINLADEYIGERIKHGVWKDSAVRLCGDGAWSMTVMFLQVWEMLSKKEETYEHYLPCPCKRATEGFVQPYADSPIDTENVGEQVYLQIIESAQHYLYITTPYLMVDDNLLSALRLAAKCGVDVRLITPGIPDKRAVHYTTRSYYRELIEAGVRIFEFKDGFIHSKTFLSDDRVATVGTANLDFRSLYLHFECGVCLYECEAIGDLKADFLDTLEKCREIAKKDCRANVFKRFAQAICRLFSPLM